MARKPTGRPPGRPKKADPAHAVNVTGVRIPDELRARLDAAVEHENAQHAARGLTTNRSALIVTLLREALDARDAAQEKPHA